MMHWRVLGPAIARRVRSLDIRDNHVSDRGVRTLLDRCFTINGPDTTVPESCPRSPALLPYMGAEMLGIYQGEDFESFLRNAFTGRFVVRLAIEDVPEGGITHLYIAGNDITVEGLSGLVRSERLHVLDAQSVASGFGRQLSRSSSDACGTAMTMPGIEKLTPVMSKYAGDSMTFLRIDHSLVTKDSPNMHADEIVQGRIELGDTALPEIPRNVAELGGVSVQPEAFELPAVQTPKYELPGDPMQFVVSPAMNDRQHTTEDDPTMNGPRRGSALAPEVVDAFSAETDRASLLSPVSALEEGTLMNGTLLMTPVSPDTTSRPASPGFESAKPVLRPRTYSSVADERKTRLNAHVASTGNLHPAMLPHISTLVLTDVPPVAPTKEVSDRLTCFIKQCAQEAWLAQSQAKLDYALPPGRKGHATALKQSADRVFALKRLVLELAPEHTSRFGIQASPWHHSSTKSMTEDRDSETLWSAAETDFSFFGDEDCSFPSLDSGRYAHSVGSNGKEVSFGNGFASQNNVPPPQTPVQPRFDTVALLSAFRKERKQAYQRNIAAGAVDPEIEGYWDGVVQVVRPGSGLRADEELDYYGNRFENGYLYR